MKQVFSLSGRAAAGRLLFLSSLRGEGAARGQEKAPSFPSPVRRMGEGGRRPDEGVKQKIKTLFGFSFYIALTRLMTELRSVINHPLPCKARERERFFSFPCIALLLAVFLILGTPLTHAAPPQTREQQLRLLQLKEADLELINARNAHVQKKKEVDDLRKLYSEDAVTGKEVRQAELELENRLQDLEAAQVKLEKTRLKFVEEAIHITLESAQKTVEQSGSRRVRVKLRNSASLEEAMTGQGAASRRKDVIPYLTVENLYVHLEQGGVVVGYPYQAHVARLAYQEPVELVYDLKKDVDNLSVVMKYHGREVSLDVYLARSQSGAGKVRLKSAQFSQTAGTGTAASFKFKLERLEESEMVLALDGVGLPEGYKLRFLDETGNPVTQVRLLRGVGALNLTAEVTVPEVLLAEDLGRKNLFFIVAATPEQFESFAAEKASRKFSENDLVSRGMAFERLELTSKGVGELELRFESLDITRLDNEPFTFQGKVLNQGTGTLREVRFVIEKPSGWEAVTEPVRVSNLASGKEDKFLLKVTPAQDTSVGAYDIKIKSRSEEEGATVESSQKTIRVTLEAQANTRAMGILATLAVVLVAGIMMYTVRLSKK